MTVSDLTQKIRMLMGSGELSDKDDCILVRGGCDTLLLDDVGVRWYDGDIDVKNIKKYSLVFMKRKRNDMFVSQEDDGYQD